MVRSWMVIFAIVLAASALAFNGAALAADRPQAGSADIAAVADANNAFALDLYAQVKSLEGNLFFSPYSISTALAMTYAGARGRTESQMAQVLHLSEGRDVVQPRIGQLIESLNAPKDARYQMHVANRLWGERSYDFSKEFLDLTQRHYGAGLEPVDFRGNAEAARLTINAWIEAQTQDRIRELIKPKMVNEWTGLVLTNAIYFKGDWMSQFDPAATEEQPFHLAPDRSVQMPLMHQEATFAYFDGEGFAILELPYAGDRLAMMVLLPDDIGGLAGLEPSLTAHNLAMWTAKLAPQKLRVWLPKWELTGEFELAELLRSMGMDDAFDPKRADFSFMRGPHATDPLFIDKVVHQAFVKVDEEGTEAAAATAVIMGRIIGVRPQAPVFRADHPFVFLIRDRQSGAILFLGRLINPSMASKG